MRVEILTDRKEFTKLLSEKTGTESKYLGAPSFGYQVGAYTVTKLGFLEYDENKADEVLIRELIAAGELKGLEDDGPDTIAVSLPIEGHTPQSLLNVLHIFCAREKLINKAIGSQGAFQMNRKFVDALDEDLPETVDDFVSRVNEAGEGILRGISFSKDEIVFEGFPFAKDPETVQAYMHLASLIVQSAQTKHRVSSKKVATQNERYTFRCWLIHLGMSGLDYKATRKVLLKNLKGNCAFRLEEQAEVAKQQVKQRREEIKACSTYQAL